MPLCAYARLNYTDNAIYLCLIIIQKIWEDGNNYILHNQVDSKYDIAYYWALHFYNSLNCLITSIYSSYNY